MRPTTFTEPTAHMTSQHQVALDQIDQEFEDSQTDARALYQDSVSPDVSDIQKLRAREGLTASIAAAQAALDDVHYSLSTTPVEVDVIEYQAARDAALAEYHDAVASGDTSAATEISLGGALSDARHNFVVAVGTPPTIEALAEANAVFEKSREEALAVYLAATPSFVSSPVQARADTTLRARISRATSVRAASVVALDAAPVQLSFAFASPAPTELPVTQFAKRSFRRSRGPGRVATFLGL